MIHPCKLVTEAVKYPSSKIKICPAVLLCEAVLAEETFLPLSGDDSCFYSPLFLPYIFPQISRSCNSWRWGSHQLPPACTGHDSVLWHSPLQRRRSEMQEISVRQQKTKEDSTVRVLLQLRANAGRDLHLLPKMQLLLWWLSCAGRSEGHHWVMPHEEKSRSGFLLVQHCSALTAVRWVQLPAHSIAFPASSRSSALDSKQEMQRVHLLNQNEVQAWWSQCCHAAGL